MPQRYNIILADDDAVGRTKVSKILSNGGFEVTQVPDGKECLEAAHANKPDLIILDVMMKDMNGFETSQALHASDDTCNIPIIFLTGLDNRFSIIKALKAGAVDYIIKPVEPKDLINKISAALHTRNLLHDKINLLKINETMVNRVSELLTHLGIISRVNQMKADLETNSFTALELLAEVRENIENYNEDAALEALSRTEAALQFSDRVAQQLNELAKVFAQIHQMITNTDDLDIDTDSLHKSSTDSVLDEKIDQSTVDDLMKMLDI